MIRTVRFDVGQNPESGKFHAVYRPEGKEGLTGPPRDTEQEAIADRDEAIRRFHRIIRRLGDEVKIASVTVGGE
jgi:hypothetical protein